MKKPAAPTAPTRTPDEPYIEYVPVLALAPDERNPKDHDVGEIIESLKRFGFVEPGVVNEATGKMVAGHGRREALLSMQEHKLEPPARVQLRENGQWYVPVIRGISFANDEEARAYLIASNRLVAVGGWDAHKLVDNLTALNRLGPEHFKGVGYDADDLDSLTKQLQRKADKEAARLFGEQAAELAADQDDAQIYELKDNVIFPSTHPLGIPDLLPDPTKLGTATPTTCYRKTIHGPSARGLALQWASGVPDEWTDCVPLFYTHDAKFESVWMDAPHIGKRLLELGVKEFVMPDYSILATDPLVLQAMAVYKSRWVARYWQELGLRCIPNIQFANEVVHQVTLPGLPPEIPVAACQIRSWFSQKEADLWKDGLRKALTQLHVHQLIVYATPSRWAEFQPVFADIPRTTFVRLVPFSESITKLGTLTRRAKRATVTPEPEGPIQEPPAGGNDAVTNS